ncbi:hypothetical protein [Paenibacillus donghaensis]|uniref:Uncharacterized protein n=1 Tax=Paenibacillus donghaensis TaxID=414771 RepID=A0A2Z2KBJ2_9BACL|nr:hypothetical protein [Paenibacillus donghaensis]ASA21035.1 hypothetical protein B9T62_09695 [Paenibacillus donghaensis]
MRNKGTEGLGMYEPFYIMLDECRIVDIVITSHAGSRYQDRINPTGSEEPVDAEVAAWMWQCLRQNRLAPYLAREYNAYLIDNDIVTICELKELEGESTLSGDPLYLLVVVTFLGRISAQLQLRNLRSFYSALSSSRRLKLAKKRRKRKKDGK